MCFGEVGLAGTMTEQQSPAEEMAEAESPEEAGPSYKVDHRDPHTG